MPNFDPFAELDVRCRMFQEKKPARDGKMPEILCLRDKSMDLNFWLV
jgi:hypothetical protein